MVWVVPHGSLVAACSQAAACKHKAGLKHVGLVCKRGSRASWPISSHRSCCNIAIKS